MNKHLFDDFRIEGTSSRPTDASEPINHTAPSGKTYNHVHRHTFIGPDAKSAMQTALKLLNFQLGWFRISDVETWSDRSPQGDLRLFYGTQNLFDYAKLQLHVVGNEMGVSPTHTRQQGRGNTTAEEFNSFADTACQTLQTAGWPFAFTRTADITQFKFFLPSHYFAFGLGCDHGLFYGTPEEALAPLMTLHEDLVDDRSSLQRLMMRTPGGQTFQA